MTFLKSLFSEDSPISMMRLISFISLIIGAYLALHGKDTSVGIFVYAAFSGKAIQKIIETKQKRNIK